jgi:DNA-directed RNA polymerase subunit RPC12/RpoP
MYKCLKCNREVNLSYHDYWHRHCTDEIICDSCMHAMLHHTCIDYQQALTIMQDGIDILRQTFPEVTQEMIDIANAETDQARQET